MENTTLPQLEEITQVYKHRKNKEDGCRCGCLGTYWSKDGSKRSDRMIKKIYNLITSKVIDVKKDHTSDTFIDVWIENRFYTMYFEKKVSQTPA